MGAGRFMKTQKGRGARREEVKAIGVEAQRLRAKNGERHLQLQQGRPHLPDDCLDVNELGAQAAMAGTASDSGAG